jgi:glutathione synthase/RimK-type ligase-like ATP-grasp enzyme
LKALVLVNRRSDWPIRVPGVEVVSGRTYLTDPSYSRLRDVRVFNLCRSYRYQEVGYYASLLAAARGQRPIPAVSTILDMKSASILRIVSDDLDDLIQHLLAPIKGERFVLSIYFGRNLAKKYDRLCAKLYNHFPAPCLQALFVKGSKWRLLSITPIAGKDIPENHWDFVLHRASDYFRRGHFRVPRRVQPRYDLAILSDPSDDTPPSDARALKRFVKAAQELDMSAELINKDDYGDIATFDGLFIRATTAVNHFTYRFAQRAEAEGLAVIDDPMSILKCANKVFLHELLQRHELPMPRTAVLHRDNVEEILATIGLPAILKQPDSAFSKGVTKVTTEEEFRRTTGELLEQSDLIIAQSFVPTDFDWRVGILDRQPLYACRYYMAQGHWQIIQRSLGHTRYGRVETMLVEEAPRRVVRTALRAANLVGDGLYGVDLKQVGRSIYVIEINDNPSIEAGDEDRELGAELYRRVMRSFVRRIERLRNGVRA